MNLRLSERVQRRNPSTGPARWLAASLAMLAGLPAALDRMLEPWTRNQRWLAWVWLAVIVAFCGYCRYVVTRNNYSLGVDGGYYASVARFVRDGKGLVTNVSMLHKGDLSFPAPTSIYPLWPLLLGYGARLFPLEPLARWLTAALFVTALLACYLCGSRLYPRSLVPRLLPGFNGGHVLTIVLGLSVFFQATTEPYTEGLAYTIMFAGFWRFQRLFVRPTWRAGLEMGTWLGLTVLARPQLAIAAVAAFSVLSYAIVFMRGQRGKYLLMLLTCGASFSAVCAPWLLYTWTFAPKASIVQILSFAGVRHSDFLGPLNGIKQGATWQETLKDRIDAFWIAFSWAQKSRSYALRYFTFQYAVLAAAPLGLLGLLYTLARRPRRVFRWLIDSANLPRIFLVVYGLGAFLALHAIHGGSGFYFHRRHGLASVVLIGVSLVYLLSWRSVVTRLVGLVILVSGVWLGSNKLLDHARVAAARPPRTTSTALLPWLRKERRKDPNLVVAMRQPQTIGYLIPEVNFHFYNKTTRRQDFEVMVTQLGVDYVVVLRSMSRWWSWRDNNFEKVTSAGGYLIYRPKPELKALATQADER